jgi:hypothetical protein
MNFNGCILPPVAESLARSTSSFRVSMLTLWVLMEPPVAPVFQDKLFHQHGNPPVRLIRIQIRIDIPIL